METRLFSKIDNEGKHIKLLMLFLDADSEELYEFKVVRGQVLETDEVVGGMMLGSNNIEEVDIDSAQSAYPDIDIDEVIADAMYKIMGGE